VPFWFSFADNDHVVVTGKNIMMVELCATHRSLLGSFHTQHVMVVFRHLWPRPNTILSTEPSADPTYRLLATRHRLITWRSLAG